jgi:hypothetical protein
MAPVLLAVSVVFLVQTIEARPPLQTLHQQTTRGNTFYMVVACVQNDALVFGESNPPPYTEVAKAEDKERMRSRILLASQTDTTDTADNDDDPNDYDQQTESDPPPDDDGYNVYGTPARYSSAPLAASECGVRVYYSSPECSRFNFNASYTSKDAELTVALCNEGTAPLTHSEGVFLTAGDGSATKFLLRGEVLEGTSSGSFIEQVLGTSNPSSFEWTLDTHALMTSASHAFSTILRQNFPGDCELPASKFTKPTYYVNRANYTDLGAAASGLFFRTVKHFVLQADSQPRAPTGAILNQDGSFNYDQSYELRLIPYPMFTMLTATRPSMLAHVAEQCAVAGGGVFFVLFVLYAVNVLCTVFFKLALCTPYAKACCCLPSANARPEVHHERTQQGGARLATRSGSWKRASASARGVGGVGSVNTVQSALHPLPEAQGEEEAGIVSTVDIVPASAASTSSGVNMSTSSGANMSTSSGANMGYLDSPLQALQGRPPPAVKHFVPPQSALPSPAIQEVRNFPSPAIAGLGSAQSTLSPKSPKRVTPPLSPPANCPRTGKVVPPI